MTEYQTDVASPGDFIKEELEARDLAQRDLAYILGTTEQVVTRLLSGKYGISPDMAKALGEAFQVSPELFVNLQAAYDLARAKEPDPGIAQRARWQNIYPVREMINRGWLRNGDSSTLEAQIQRFFKAANLNEVAQPAHAAKKTNSGDPATPAQLAWLYRVVQLAEAMNNNNYVYSERALGETRRSLKKLMVNPADIERVPALLAECGLRFLIVEGLPTAKIDGVCIWLDSTTPVIALSLRYDRIDNFWFVLWHELTHLLNRDGKTEGDWTIDVELEKDRPVNSKPISVQESKANQGATENCVPEGDLISFLARRDRYIAEQDVLFFARQMKVHPGIVVGQIQNRTKKYELLRKYQVKIRQYIMPTATVDGWGQVARISV